MHHGKEKINEEYKSRPDEFDYGSLRRIPTFKGSHPKVMDDFRSTLSWKNKLNYSGKSMLNRDKMKHERLKYQLITFLENLFNGGKDIIGYTNWNKVKISDK